MLIDGSRHSHALHTRSPPEDYAVHSRRCCWSYSIGDMKHIAERGIRTAHESASHLENGDVGQEFCRRRIAQAGRICVSQISKVCLAGDTTKRKYEDMTSVASGIQSREIRKDEDLMLRLSSFHENKKRRPPEADTFKQIQETKTNRPPVLRGKDGIHVRKAGSWRRSPSGSEIVATPEPDNCGESDLTAEIHMADESSRSSNNDDFSTFESAAESVSRDGRSFPNTGIVDYFQDRTNRGPREVAFPSSCSQGHTSDAEVVTNRISHFNREETGSAVELYSGDGSQFRILQTEEPRSATKTLKSGPESQVWGKNIHEWLQLGLGSSYTVPSSNTSDANLEGNSGRDIMHDRNVFDGQLEMSSNLPISENQKANDLFGLKHTKVNYREWRAGGRANTMAPSSKLLKPNHPPTDLGFAKRLVASSSERASDVDHEGQPQLCLFGSNLAGPVRTQVMRDPRSSSNTGDIASDTVRIGSAKEDTMETLRRGQEGFQGLMAPPRYEGVGQARSHRFQVRQSEVQNRARPFVPSTSSPAADDHFRSAQPSRASLSDQVRPVQFEKGVQLHSLPTLVQWRDVLHPGQARHSWLPDSAGDSERRLVPTVKISQDWNPSGTTSNTKFAAGKSGSDAGPGAGVDKQSTTAVDQRAGKEANELVSLFRDTGPNVLFPFQSPSQKSAPLVIPRSTNPEVNVRLVSSEGERSLADVTRNIENIRSMPQWPSRPEAANLDTIATTWSRRSTPGVPREEPRLNAQNLGGERPSLMPSSSQSQSVPPNSRFGVDHFSLLHGEPSSRRKYNWQHAIEQEKPAEDPNVRRRSPTPTAAEKPKFRVLPFGSRERNQAGLWFVLRSAENQTGEGSLPQLSKAYLRIKDGNMPVSAVKKYLVTKLGLASESEVEITCNGHPILPSLPLQHVRDAVWYSSLSSKSSTEHAFASTSSGDANPTTSIAGAASSSQHQQHASLLESGGKRASVAATKQNLPAKDILMVLTYSKPLRSLQS